MSRTIRRTRGNPHELYTFREVISLKGNPFSEILYIKPGHPEYDREYWNVHKDTHRGIYGVPRWYRAQLNKECDRDEQQRLARALRRGEEEELVFNPRKKNAGYYWW